MRAPDELKWQMVTVSGPEAGVWGLNLGWATFKQVCNQGRGGG